VSFLTIS